MKALVIGAAGHTGMVLVDKLLQDSDYTCVVVFVNRSTGKKHTKFREYIVNLSDIDSYRKDVVGDVLFFCFETAINGVAIREHQWKSDIEILNGFIMLACENGVNSFILESSLNASSNSWVHYFRMKGILEEMIAEFYFEQYVIFKPGLIIKERTSWIKEKIIVNTLRVFNAMGMFEEFRPLSASLLAEKLVKAPKVLPSGTSVIKFERIFTL
ncbi:semialdehyde dehydrogenase [Flavobacterium sp. LHD-85]|uniref:semialdehyde dehydrogenase n=1 Tax=Flavobacterium sp. LHD-85 TaxID=3071410 RepID=UPI0027DF84F5|nr:semialdehyde dehydrogenase [Flavobacterium sp. LHD-85]MDQ6530953.1 semialdehyde dehydrogenase [Flavobacterium sp. LHD-85]